MADEPEETVVETDPVITAFETLVFAPIGLGAKLVDDAPAVVRRVRQELNNARFIGRLTVEQGAARLRDRVPRPPDRHRDRAVTADDVADIASGDVASGDVTSADGASGDVASNAGVLAIVGYDELPAIEIVGMLADLTPAQRDAVAEHEAANRRRRTVLGKIAQLSQ